MTQGLIEIETRGHRSWFDETQPIIYVKALASAPWNRGLRQVPRYKYTGSSLLLFVRRRSVALRYAGRIGLHSLPGAVEFYRKSRMLELGRDPDCDNLTYFEFACVE
ncbi:MULTISPECIES: hypothetical protein [Spirulina sp. CCY15215]|uniref:hypothetical protein n=1 Tax=Spirulina sp. CCY15215 TaxID=2767591 RepID=UPI001950A8FB|nr:hypothetical protein [Spirulina major]